MIFHELNGEIYTITKTSRGDFAMGTQKGEILFFSLESQSLSDDSHEKLKVDGFISFIIEAKEGSLYFFTQKGIFVLQRGKKDQSQLTKLIPNQSWTPINIYPNYAGYP